MVRGRGYLMTDKSLTTVVSTGSQSDLTLTPPQLHPLVQIRSLLAPRKQNGDSQLKFNSRLQNDSPQTNGGYIHFIYAVFATKLAF